MNIFEGLDYKVLKEVNKNFIYDGIEYDSRKIKNNFIFVALEGNTVDGHDYIDKAVLNGATCIIVSKKVEIKYDVNYYLVENLRENLSIIASNFYDYPQNKLTIIGVTGTNGKTTSTYMIEKLLGEEKVSRIGTIEYKIGNEVINAPNTTPESAELIKLMYMSYNKGIKYIVMEVSSHSLELGRVNSINFDYALFTNLTPDHLDYHKDMDNYFLAKRKLFLKLKNKSNAVINIDDKYGKKLYDEFKCYGALSYGLNEAELKISNENNLDFLNYKNIKSEFINNTIGTFNIYNILGSVGIAIKIGIPFEEIVEKIPFLNPAPGRFEPVNIGQNFKVIIDYAHTPDALENILKTAKNLEKNKLITVFGCGGDRDKTKRPIMAKIAEKYSDVVILTSDNPRTEDPKKILDDVFAGFENKNHFTEINREKAIEYAINIAEKNDIVIIAGKGHENYQIIGREKIHFDDREIAQEYIEKKLLKK